MTIRRTTPEVEIKEGDFILGNPFTNYAIVGHAGKVTMVSGQRLYYDRFAHDGLIDSTHMNRSQVAFVCDTREEVDSLVALSEYRAKETKAAMESVEERFKYETEVCINSLIERAQ